MTRGAVLYGSLVLVASSSMAGVFGVAELFSDPSMIGHPQGYVGSGGAISLTICIDPSSAHANDLIGPLEKAIETINAPSASTGNQKFLEEQPSNRHDAESVLLHELLHCTYGLGHTNLVLAAGSLETDFTNALKGADGQWTILSYDSTQGNEEDIRGDDINLHWYRKSDNNPLLYSAPADSSTMSVELDALELLPDHYFAVSINLGTSADRGFPATKSVMFSNGAIGATLRDLAPDDLSMIMLSRSGLDETAGTADDFTLELRYTGLTTACDLVIRVGPLADSVTGRCNGNAATITPTLNHFAIDAPVITLTDVPNVFYFEPSERIFSDGFETGTVDRWSQDL